MRAAVRSGERRRTVRRRVWAGLGVLIGLPALAVGLYWGGHQAWLGMFAENPFFEIKRIEITTDGKSAHFALVDIAAVLERLRTCVDANAPGPAAP